MVGDLFIILCNIPRQPKEEAGSKEEKKKIKRLYYKLIFFILS